MKIKVIPLASESMGTRSMCTFIETPDVRILVDPGVSMGRRWGLLPHPLEYGALLKSRKRIAHFAERSKVVTISHYHFDHCTPSFTDYVWNFSSFEVAKQIFNNKIILAKDPRNRINAKQRRRGWLFKKMMSKYVNELRVADGATFTFRDTKLVFSEPVFHGEKNTPLGWVLMVCVEYKGEKVMHASDVQGPMLKETLEKILSANPILAYVGGPPLYLADYMVERRSIQKGLRNLVELSAHIPVLIVDHHLLRTEEWQSFSREIFAVARTKEHSVMTAAEFLGEENLLFEARRRALYEDDPPSRAFMDWTSLPRVKQKAVLPPL